MSEQDAFEGKSGLMEELSALRQENHNLHGINAALRQQLAVGRLETDAVARRERHLNGQVEQLDQRLASLHASVSWKVTKPIRWARRWGLALRDKLPPAAAARVQPRRKPVEQEETWGAIGVFAHIYYEDLAPELAAYVARVPEPRRVYLSTDTEAKATRIREACVAAGLGQAVDVRVFPNRGFDVAPFLVGFASEIERHALVVRLHGKKSSHLGEEAGTVWRRMLLDSLLGDDDRVKAILAAFRRLPHLGLVCPEHWDGLYRLYDAPISVGSNLAAMARLLGRYNVPLSAATPIDFPSGSMFWCRSAALAPWLRFGFSWESFEVSGEESRDASVAHAVERSFLFGCGLEGLTWARADRLPSELLAKEEQAS